ncbi:MAG TPA: hypothetical protein VFG50_15120 [Rhodothermales bacterium]|nr:hypothetical protein [Rhodothermales bacterium]
MHGSAARMIPVQANAPAPGPKACEPELTLDPALSHGLAVAFELESHDHPSAVQPYQDAAIGVGGIHCDICSSLFCFEQVSSQWSIQKTGMG